MVRVRVLGALEVFDGSSWVEVSASRLRAVLAALVAARPGAISRDVLVDEVWDGDPPRSASTQIHGYVMRLRRLLQDRDGDVLVTGADGYRLALPHGGTDADVADSLMAKVDSALTEERYDEAAYAASDLLGLWRGDAYSRAQLTTRVAPEAERLRELRLLARERLMAAESARGRYDVVVRSAREQLAQHPLRERSWQYLMLALWHLGRQGEALGAYRRLRSILVEELGVEPCREIRELRARILAGEHPVQEPGTNGSEQRPASQERCVIGRAAQLPAGVSDFTGRSGEVDEVAAGLCGEATDPSPRVVVVHGPPGIGKSTVAVRAAWQVVEEFADGQIYLDAAGTSDEPRHPAELVAEVLVSLGINGHALPHGVGARTALLRSALTDCRVLIVLDDAGSSEQVRALLPPTNGSAVLVTSRRFFTEVAGSRHTGLGPLSQDEALELLSRIVGRDRVERESGAAQQIVRTCGLHPLSIRIAGGKLLGRPHWSLESLLARLGDESRRLSELRLGDLDVRTSVDLSLRSLDPNTRRAFSLLGLLGPCDVPGWVLGPLLDRPSADEELDCLVDSHLLAQKAAGPDGQPRYRLHDLLRLRAVETCTRIPENEQRAAVTRVLERWLVMVEHAMGQLPTSPLVVPRGRSGLGEMSTHEASVLLTQPLAWFDAQRSTLLGVVRLAAEWDLPDLCWRLAAALVPYFDNRAHYEDWRRTHELALSLRQGEIAQGTMLRGLAQVHVYLSKLAEAEDCAARSLALFRRAGDRHGEAMALAAMVTSDRLAGRLEAAGGHVREALAIVTTSGDRSFEALLRCSAASILLAREMPGEAGVWFEQALRMAREVGDEHREALVLRELSQLQLLRGEPEHALAGLGRAERILTDLQDEQCVAFVMTRVARICAATGEVEQARSAWTSAAETFRRNGTLDDEAACRREVEALTHPSSTITRIDRSRVEAPKAPVTSRVRRS